MIFKIISSNIRFNNPLDGIHKWDNRKQILANIINEFAPDILGTQEGRKQQLLELASLLNNLTLVESHRKWIAVRMYPTIFINPHTIRVLSSGDIWLSTTPSVPGSSSFNSTFPRLCTWIEAEFKFLHSDFIFVNVHLDHILTQTRLKQIRVLIAEVKKINHKNLPLILCGDFNESPTGEVRKAINKELSNLYDPWFQFNKKEMASYHSFNRRTDGERIDWIMVDRKIQCQSLCLDTITHHNIYPSDHYPVKGVFRF